MCLNKLLLVVSLSLITTGVPSAQPVRFFDPYSGANFVQWWQTVGVPACATPAGAEVRHATTNAVALFQRLKTAQPGNGDVDLIFLPPERIVQFQRDGLLEDLRRYSADMPNLARTEGPDNEMAAGVPLNGVAATFHRFGYAITYNAKAVPNPPRSFKELYERRNEWKGKISYVDPRDPNSPAGRYFVAAFLKAFGADLRIVDGRETPSWQPAWERLADFEKANFPKHPTTTGPLVTLYGSGEVVIGSTPVDYIAYSQKIGVVPDYVKIVLPQEGSPGGAGYLAIPKSAPDGQKVKAARFINCALSEEVQVGMTSQMYEYPGTNVWAKLPATVYERMPDEQTMKSTRFLPSDEALNYISKMWQEKVGY